MTCTTGSDMFTSTKMYPKFLFSLFQYTIRLTNLARVDILYCGHLVEISWFVFLISKKYANLINAYKINVNRQNKRKT